MSKRLNRKIIIDWELVKAFYRSIKLSQKAKERIWQNIIKQIKNMSDEIESFKSGIVPDPRPAEEKAKDYRHEEISSAVPLSWHRDISGAPVYSLRDQDGSGSCVGQGSAKGEETLTGKVISAHPIYRRRMNYPGVGMYLQNAGDIVAKQGTTTEDLDPSQRMTEEQMNVPVTVDTPIKSRGYVMVDFTSIDSIAEAIETYKHCLLTFGFDLQEYAYTDKPVNNGKPANAYHCICGVYYFTDASGEKCILADESWGPNNIRRRIITESYLKTRGTGAMYFLPASDKPYYVFKNQLSYGVKNNVDVKYLQDILKYEKLFPLNILSTGNYLQITAKSILAFQLKYQVDSPDVLNALAGKHVGPKTLAKLNELYGS